MFADNKLGGSGVSLESILKERNLYTPVKGFHESLNEALKHISKHDYASCNRFVNEGRKSIVSEIKDQLGGETFSSAVTAFNIQMQALNEIEELTEITAQKDVSLKETFCRWKLFNKSFLNRKRPLTEKIINLFTENQSRCDAIKTNFEIPFHSQELLYSVRETFNPEHCSTFLWP